MQMRYDIFPEIKRKIYNWTFLKDVSLSILFNVNEKNIDEDAISRFFKDNFKIAELKKQALGTDKGIRIQSEDKCINFDFSFSKIELKIKYPLYREFNNMISWLPVILNFLRIAGVNEVSQLVIRKYNELVFSMPNGRGDIPLAMKEIFSPKLLGENFNMDAKSFSDLNRWERKLVVSDDTERSQVNISFGFCEKDGVSSGSALTLSTSITTHDWTTGIVDLQSRLGEMNLVIDRVFRWCVTDSIINKMQGNNE